MTDFAAQYLIVPKININGESRQTHIDLRLSLHDALREAMGRLKALRPHPRDYQTCDEPQRALQADLAIYIARYNHLDRLANEILGEALCLKTGETD